MKKLTPSKMLSSMALATLLVAAAGTTSAQAAGFNYTAPNGNQAGAEQHTNGPTTVTGDIQINGNFNKTVTSLPAPNQAGSFLIVTMPLNLDYTYNADSGVLTGAQGVIENKSVKVTGVQGSFNYTPQPIEMQIVSLTQGNHTTDKEVMFVDNYDTNANDKIQVPLQLTLTSPSATPQTYKFVDLVNPGTTVANALSIDPNTNVNIEIEEIPGKSVGNAHLITKDKAVASHALKLQFEYKGQ